MQKCLRYWEQGMTRVCYYTLIKVLGIWVKRLEHIHRSDSIEWHWMSKWQESVQLTEIRWKHVPMSGCDIKMIISAWRGWRRSLKVSEWLCTISRCVESKSGAMMWCYLRGVTLHEDRAVAHISKHGGGNWSVRRGRWREEDTITRYLSIEKWELICWRQTDGILIGE